MSNNWPMADAYVKILQNPQLAFKDPELKKCKITTISGTNQPKPMAGAFAVVFQGILPNKAKRAIRAFTSERTEMNDRYDAICKYLDRHKNLKSIVEFTYKNDGIRAVDNKGRLKGYPLVTMDWVPGETLFEWVRGQCDARGSRPLRDVADRWVELTGELAAATIAHGDLQHANVMVTDQGELKLVDYDCMCVPDLVGQPNLEIGVEPYQHPGRNSRTLLSPTLDNFSALFILCALRALAAAPNLWNDYIAKDNYDKLLFRTEDFEAGLRSNLYQALMRSSDPDVGRLSKNLFELYRAKIDEVPPLSNVLFSYDRVESLLTQKSWDEAVELLARKGQTNDAPAKLQRLIVEAQDRVRHRKELEIKVQAGDELGMQQWYKPALLDDYPAAQPAVAVARHAPRVITILGQLQQAQQREAWRDFVRIWDTDQKVLEGRASARPFQGEANTWRTRNQACDELLRWFRQNPPELARLTAAHERLQQLGGHPETIPHQPAIDKLIERGRAWAQFQQALQLAQGGLGEDSDQSLVRSWNDAAFAGWPEAQRERSRVDQAQQRLRNLQALNQAAQRLATGATEADEQGVVQLAGALPSGYRHSQAARAQLAQQRLQGLAAVRAAVVEPAVESAIEAAWQTLERVQGQSLVTAPLLVRVQLAQRRAPLIKAIKQISLQQSPPQLDEQILAAWNEAELGPCHEVRPWQQAFAIAVGRKSIISQLQAALDQADADRVAQLGGDPCLAGYPLPRALAQAVDTLQRKSAAARGLIQALKTGDRDAFRELFDTQLIQENQKLFANYRQQLIEWLRDEMSAGKGRGPGSGFGQGVVKSSGPNPSYSARWAWPHQRFANECILALTRHRPEANATPLDASPLESNRVTRAAAEQAGGKYVIHPRRGLGQAYVVVWALIDLGFETCYSQPLILGRL